MDSVQESIKTISKFLKGECLKEGKLQESFELLITAVEEQQEAIDLYKLQEYLLLERLKKQTLQIKEMKQNSRLTRFWDMAEENLRMAQELQRCKDMLKGGNESEQCQTSHSLS